ncbi:MAG TPA: Holliday junction resolvase RuvX [Xylella sp.]
MPEAPLIFPDGIVLGFDVGIRRIGVAVGSRWGAGARAVAVIDVHGAVVDWNALDRVHSNWRPVGLVVGDPLTLDGQDQSMRQHAYAFARLVRERYRLPVVLVDERSTSVEAARHFADARAAGYKRRRDADTLDAMAAAVIVERWLADPKQAILLP